MKVSGTGACKGVRESEMGLGQVSGSEKGLGIAPSNTVSVHVSESSDVGGRR